MSQASFAKRQREKARREKAAMKQERRQERQAASGAEDDAPPPPPVDEDALLAELASLHARFDNGDIEFEDFDAAKQEITERLQVN